MNAGLLRSDEDVFAVGEEASDEVAGMVFVGNCASNNHVITAERHQRLVEGVVDIAVGSLAETDSGVGLDVDVDVGFAVFVVVDESAAVIFLEALVVSANPYVVVGINKHAVHTIVSEIAGNRCLLALHWVELAESGVLLSVLSCHPHCAVAVEGKALIVDAAAV